MNKRAILAATAIVVGSFNPVLATAAWADTVPTPTADATDATTLAAMQNQCDILAAAHDIGNGDEWTGEVVEGAVTLVAGPTEVDGTRDIDEDTIVGTGTFTPGSTYIQGDPFRIGGSVNMFGDQYADAGSWSDSTYNFTADFDSTFQHAFSCNIYQAVFHAEQTIHHEAEGQYVLRPDLVGTPQGEAAQQSCIAFNNAHQAGEDQGFWGNTPHGNCVFEGTQAYDEIIPESLDDPALVGNEPGTPVNQDQTDSLEGFEDHGGPVQAEGGPFHIGQVVICISPSTSTKKGVPGEWRTQNGYPGTNCTTDWFKNHAVWGSGTESSNGTYISVPDYSL